MKILYTLPALDGGGIDRILFDYTIRFPEDVQCDFIVHTDYEGILEKELENKGYNIYHIPPLHKDKILYISNIKKILECGDYDVIHVNQGFRGLFFLYYAKKYGIKVRIAHSHMAFNPENIGERIVRAVTTNIVKKLTTHLFACGNDAAKWMWGEKAFNNNKVYIMKNAINTDQFAFSNEKRERIRSELMLDNKFVVGNVARFSYQKNHAFLINIFAEIKKRRTDAVLMLVGRGELENNIKTQVGELGLCDSVLFMGVRNDVADLLNAMDIFVLPSRYEGLPVSLVEVQANGLPTFMSDTITGEVKLLPTTYQYSILDEAEKWAVNILQAEVCRNSNSFHVFSESNYNIDVATRMLIEKYNNVIRN